MATPESAMNMDGGCRPKSSSELSSPPPTSPVAPVSSPVGDEIVALVDGTADERSPSPAENATSRKGGKRKKRSLSSSIGRAPLEAVSKVVKKAEKAVADSAARRKAKKWEAPFVFESDKSPLATDEAIDIRAILCKPEAWNCLDQFDKMEIVSLFPDWSFISQPGTMDAHPDITALLNSNDFRNDCTRYRDNIRDGRHDPEFIAQAWTAHRKRKAGGFDKFLAKRFKDNWGVDPPEYDAPKTPEPEEEPQSPESKQEQEKQQQQQPDLAREGGAVTTHSETVPAQSESSPPVTPEKKRGEGATEDGTVPMDDTVAAAAEAKTNKSGAGAGGGDAQSSSPGSLPSISAGVGGIQVGSEEGDSPEGKGRQSTCTDEEKSNDCEKTR